MTVCHKTMASPVGSLTLVATDNALTAVLWENDPVTRVPHPRGPESKNHPMLLLAEQQLQEYFTGQRQHFTLPLHFTGTTFQKNVWQALLSIPFGQTRSYAQIAQQLGNPKAVRAVGAANGRNPLSIIAPCHRVIGSNGSLTGFAGGLDAKKHLLSLESLA